MELVYYTPHKLYSYDHIKQEYPIQFSFSQMFNPSISLIDRTFTINCPPINVKVLDPFPIWESTSSFEDICLHRYNDLVELVLSTDKKLVIFYSGGIDSTLIAALSISHPNFHHHKSSIFLAFSEDSIKENPRFWYEHLLPNFGNRLISSIEYHTCIANDDYICVSGEFADNIFGSLTVKSYMDNTGDFSAIHKEFSSTGLPWLSKKITNKLHIEECRHMITSILDTSPRRLVTNHDCFWWLNFVLKWQAVKFRLSSHSPSTNTSGILAKNIIHFFETPEFQQWAVTTNEKKVDDDWFSYKLPAKKIIYDINLDEYYFKWKTKYPSIPGLTRYANTHDFIYINDHNEYIASKELLSGDCN